MIFKTAQGTQAWIPTPKNVKLIQECQSRIRESFGCLALKLFRRLQDLGGLDDCSTSSWKSESMVPNGLLLATKIQNSKSQQC